MGAQLDVVVDVPTRGDRVPLIATKMVMVKGVEHSLRVSSSGTADSSDGKPNVVNLDKDEVMAEEYGNASKKNTMLKTTRGKDVGGLSDNVVSNGLPHDGGERLMKNDGSRKRKKTIHFMNSRVPHAVPVLETSEGSEDQDSPEEADDVPVRPSQAPRVAISKVGLRNCTFSLRGLVFQWLCVVTRILVSSVCPISHVSLACIGYT